MKGRPIDQLVYEHLFPKPKPTDPPNFHLLLQRHLILEVRQEVHSFYGHLDTPEAKYPGLDYCHPIHRIRLSRWPWHRRLFRAFDSLRLTPHEIATLTKWEGTKWAKERYEKEQGVVIRDTTADGFPDWVEPEDRPNRPRQTTALAEWNGAALGGRSTSDGSVVSSASRAAAPASASVASALVTGRYVDDDDDLEMEDAHQLENAPASAAASAAAAVAQARDEAHNLDEAAHMDEAGDSDDFELSVGVPLNIRLRDAVARREAGEQDVVFDEDWEQWFKNAIENGDWQMLQRIMSQVPGEQGGWVPRGTGEGFGSGRSPAPAPAPLAANASAATSAAPRASTSPSISSSPQTAAERMEQPAQYILDYLQGVLRSHFESQPRRLTPTSNDNSAASSMPGSASPAGRSATSATPGLSSTVSTPSATAPATTSTTDARQQLLASPAGPFRTFRPLSAATARRQQQQQQRLRLPGGPAAGDDAGSASRRTLSGLRLPGSLPATPTAAASNSQLGA